MTFVVATWNVQWQFGEWQQRQQPIVETLRALDADIVLMQETWHGQVERFASELGYHHVWAGHDPHGDPERNMGNAILSRWSIERHAYRFLEDAKGRQYRSILAATLATPSGPWPVFSTHIDHRFDQSATRVSQLQQASEFIEEQVSGELPPLLGGDFNAVHDSDEIRKLTGRSAPYVKGRIWTDAWEQVGDDSADPAGGITWSKQNPYINNSAWPNRRLDYLFIGWPRENRPQGNPQRAWLFGIDAIDGIVASDHYGLAVELHS